MQGSSHAGRIVSIPGNCRAVRQRVRKDGVFCEERFNSDSNCREASPRFIALGLLPGGDLKKLDREVTAMPPDVSKLVEIGTRYGARLGA